jgi:hypothetical protein
VNAPLASAKAATSIDLRKERTEYFATDPIENMERWIC